MDREEAIKIVRNIYQTDAEKEALGTLIPELAESEDERMCTRCIELLRKVSAYSGEEYLGVEIADCIIWLQALMKKQKKPENVSATTMAPSCWEVEQKEQKPEDRFEEAREKYQVKWSEEDENIFNDILLDMADRREMFKSKGETTFAENTQKKIDWLDRFLGVLNYNQSKSGVRRTRRC